MWKDSNGNKNRSQGGLGNKNELDSEENTWVNIWTVAGYGDLLKKLKHRSMEIMYF